MSDTPSQCLSDDVAFDFVAARLSKPATHEAERHLGACATCAAVVAELTKLAFPSSVAPANEILEPETAVSRYVIGPVLGIGGGGVVHEAYDPQLRRKVALKLIDRVAPVQVDEAAAHERLLREAHAMARLAHPNVVYVYDAGVFEGRVFIVMELIEGETLTDWLARRPRSSREIVEVFASAGAGLAAAHAANLVHGDFKPQNVLIGADGRVRVTDFGLARPALIQAPAADVLPAARPPARPGATVQGGTPAYMAPERIAGQPTDARSDQFSFAVALFSALYGAHPFERWPLLGATPGGVRPYPDDARGPRALYDRLLPALRTNPGERYPTMDGLLAALARAERPPLSRWIVMGGAAVFVMFAILAVVAGWPMLRARVVASTCGNGVVEPSEECDDSNQDDSDSCVSGCRFARCGDGKLRARVEECDDGNQRDGDTCSRSCLACKHGAASFVLPETGRCYARGDEPLPWHEARDRCAGWGGHLVSFGNPSEAYATAELLRSGAQRAWIGLFRDKAGGQFSWVGGDPWTDALARWWQETPRTGGNCVRATWGSGMTAGGLQYRATWSDAPCEAREKFLCEQSAWSVAPGSNHAYRIHYRPVSWEGARASCSALGARLAQIDSETEHRFIASMASVAVWLAATDGPNEGEFRWATGEPLGYSRFAPGEPDGQRLGNCVALDVDDLWHDRGCDLAYASLCEID